MKRTDYTVIGTRLISLESAFHWSVRKSGWTDKMKLDWKQPGESGSPPISNGEARRGLERCGDGEEFNGNAVLRKLISNNSVYHQGNT